MNDEPARISIIFRELQIQKSLHLPISMLLHVLDLTSGILNDLVCIDLGHTQNPSQRCKCVSIEPSVHHFSPPFAQLLEVVVLGPWTQWKLFDANVDIRKASAGEKCLELCRLIRNANLGKSLPSELKVLRHGALLVVSVVVTVEVLEITFVEFDIASWLGVFINLANELVPVLYRAQEIPDMHEVEIVFGPCPGVLEIVNFEFDVWWHPSWLDGRKVCSCHFGVWETITLPKRSERAAMKMVGLHTKSRAHVPSVLSETIIKCLRALE